MFFGVFDIKIYPNRHNCENTSHELETDKKFLGYVNGAQCIREWRFRLKLP